jgi:hypothetical protein
MTVHLILAMVLGLAGTLHAAHVPGRGGNCAAVWDTGTAAVTASMLTCDDGDPSCDTDGPKNNTCTVALSACTGVAGCASVPKLLSNGVVKHRLTGFGLPDPTSASCGTPGSITLRLRGKKHKPSKPARLVLHGKHFLNLLKVKCAPCPPDPTAACNSGKLPPSCGAGHTLTLTVPPPFDPNHPELGNGSDLDNGWTGTSHNFPVIDGSSLKYCLTGCDSVSTFDCELSGTTAVSGDSNSLNGATFGAPLPLLAANVPVCVVNRFQDPVLTGHYNLQTGEAGTPDNPNTVNLFSDVYLRTSFTGEVCPRCNVPGGGGKLGDKGTCSSSAKNAGAACVVDGEVTVAGKGLYLLSSACTPLGDSPPTSLDIRLPFTTGTTALTGSKPCAGQTQDDACGTGTCNATCTGAACNAMHDGQCIDAKGGISQLCCSNQTSTPCFPTKGGGSITRVGTPATPGGTLVAAATFCIGSTDSTLINVTTGLPGPGALLLPNQVKVE